MVQRLEQYLTAHGYGFIAISIAKLVRVGGQYSSPGAACLAIDRRMMQAAPHEASALRRLADQLDEMFRQSGSPEATEGAIEDVTHRYCKSDAPREGA